MVVNTDLAEPTQEESNSQFVAHETPRFDATALEGNTAETRLQQVQTTNTVPETAPIAPTGRKPRSSWAAPVVSEPLVQIETGDEPQPEPVVAQAEPVTVVPEPEVVIPEPVAPQPEPAFNPASLSTVLKEAGLELVQTRSAQTEPVVSAEPVKLGRPRKAPAQPEAAVELVQIDTTKE